MHLKVSGHFFFSEMSLDIAFTLVRGPGWLSAFVPRLALLLLFFRPATNRDRPAVNRDRSSFDISLPQEGNPTKVNKNESFIWLIFVI